MPSVRPSLLELWRASHATSAVLAGIAASIPASGIGALIILFADLLQGRAPGATFVLIGGIVGSRTVGMAIALHLLTGAVWGACFGLLVAFTAHHIAPVAGALWGAIYGVAVWLVWFVLVLPWFAHDLAAQTRLGLFWHVAYGATLGGLFHFLRVSERRRHRPADRARGETVLRPR